MNSILSFLCSILLWVKGKKRMTEERLGRSGSSLSEFKEGNLKHQHNFQYTPWNEKLLGDQAEITEYSEVYKERWCCECGREIIRTISYPAFAYSMLSEKR